VTKRRIKEERNILFVFEITEERHLKQEKIGREGEGGWEREKEK
jgi:hypothetical protein